MRNHLSPKLHAALRERTKKVSLEGMFVFRRNIAYSALLFIILISHSNPAASQNGSVPNPPDSGGMEQEPTSTLDYIPCLQNDECAEHQYCRATNVITWEGIPWIRGECVPCHLCQCHRQSVDGTCPERCGLPGAEVSELQGLFYTNGSMPNDPPGCSTIVSYYFVGRRFRRSVVQLNWDSKAEFSSGERSNQCGNVKVQWGDFIVNPILPAQITMRYFENTALGFSAVSGILSSACPDALDVQWAGRSDPERWIRASTGRDLHKPSPAGMWEGKLNVFGSVCEVTLNMRWLIGDSNLFHWDAYVHSCTINFDEIPTIEEEEEEAEEEEETGRRTARTRWISAPRAPQLDGQHEKRRLLASGRQLLPSFVDGDQRQFGEDKPLASAAVASSLETSRRSEDIPAFVITNFTMSPLDYDNSEQLPRLNCTQIGKICPTASSCWHRVLKPAILSLALRNPPTSESNFTVSTSLVDCVCPQVGFVPKFDSPTVAGSCIDLDECQLRGPVCPQNSDCQNQEGTFSCPCLRGFNQTDTGGPCFNLDECAAELDDCAQFADCSDTVGSFQCICKTGFGGDGVTCSTLNEVGFEPSGARPIGVKIALRIFWDLQIPTDVADVIGLFKGWDRQISWLYMSAAQPCPNCAPCPTQSECLGAECILACHTIGQLDAERWSYEFLVNSAGPGLYTIKYFSHKLGAIVATGSILVNGTNPEINWRVPPDAREFASGGLAACSSLGVGAECEITVPLGGGLIELPLEGTPVPIEFKARCGDGRMTAGNETCDDGNNVAGDGCSADCQIEPDAICAIVFNPDIVYDEDLGIWYVQGIADSSCIVFVCADGDRNARAERCDDGNLRNGDGCSDECTIEPGFDCERADRIDASGNIIGTFERCIPFILWLEPSEKDGCPPCHPLGDCVLWKGEKMCYCYDGYAKNWTRAGDVDRPLVSAAEIAVTEHRCQDIDECFGIAEDICSSNAVCSNTVGSFVCGCPRGFFGSGYGTSGFCTDVNECESPVCAPNAICTNNQGSFQCACPDGQSGGARAEDGLCKDIDECDTGAHDCGAVQICVNYGGEDFPNLNLWECMCPIGLIKFSTECFPPGFADENLDFFERMGQDGIPVHAQGLMRFWDLDFVRPWGRLSFGEWHYVDEMIAPTLHKSLALVPSTGYDRSPVNCPSCSSDGTFVTELEGVLSFEQGVWLSDLTCRWIFNKKGNEGPEFVFFHFREFHLERDLEYLETCRIGEGCARYDEASQVPVAKVEAPFELFFHSRSLTLMTPGSQNPPEPANPWKFFIVFSPQEQFNEIEFDWRPLRFPNIQELQTNFSVNEQATEFKNNSRMRLSITNGAGQERALPCGFQHDTSSSHSVMNLDKLTVANHSETPARPKARTELEGVWEGSCFPHVPVLSATCQVDLRVEENTFELSYFSCTGFAIESLATGLIYQVDEVATDIVSLSEVHLLSYKRFTVQYTSGIPTDTLGDLTTANGIFLWRTDAEFAEDEIEINLHRPAQMPDPTDFPGDNSDLEIQTKPCQYLYLRRFKRETFAIPPPIPSRGTVFYAAVQQQNLYTACNDSVSSLMDYLREINCNDDLAGILGTAKAYATGEFRAECASGCLPLFKARLVRAASQCEDAWSSLQRQGSAPGVSEHVFHYLGGRVLFLAASQQRADTVCIGSYRNFTCNQLPDLVPSVIAGSCPISRIPPPLPPEIGTFPYTRFDLQNSLQTGCTGQCLDRMLTFMLLGHCCMVVMDVAQRGWWSTMTPWSETYELDMAAYRCMYEGGPCDQSVSDKFTIEAPQQACAFTGSESWSCAYGACQLGLPAQCCQPFPCRNGAWRESHGACYCRCANAHTGFDCGSRAIHVEAAVRFTESNMISFDEQTFLRLLAEGIGVSRANCEMGFLNVIEGDTRRIGGGDIRRIGRMVDTVEVGFRVLVESEREALRQAATLLTIQQQGTFAITFGNSGFGTFADFTTTPIPRGSNGDALCDDEVFLCPDTIANGGLDDGSDFVAPEPASDYTGVIAGATIGGLVLCACCVAYLVINKDEIIHRFEGREGDFEDHKKHRGKKKMRKLSRKERKEQNVRDRIQREQASGLVFGFGNSKHDHERAKEIERASKAVKFSRFAMDDGQGGQLARTSSYNQRGQSQAVKEALLVSAAAHASDANAVETDSNLGEDAFEVDPGLSLKRIAAQQRLLAVRLANLDGPGSRFGLNDPQQIEPEEEPDEMLRAAPISYSYPDVLMPEESYPHEDYEGTVEYQREAKQRQDNVLDLFDRAHGPKPAPPKSSSREISFLPAVVNFPPPPGYLSASLAYPSAMTDRIDNGNGNGNGHGAPHNADSLLSSSMAPPPIPLQRFEVPVTPERAGKSYGSDAAPPTNSITRTLSSARRASILRNSLAAAGNLNGAGSFKSAVAANGNGNGHGSRDHRQAASLQEPDRFD